MSERTAAERKGLVGNLDGLINRAGREELRAALIEMIKGWAGQSIVATRLLEEMDAAPAPATDPVADRDLTLEEAADILGCSVATVRREIRRGRLHSVTRGQRMRRVTQASLDAYRARR